MLLVVSVGVLVSKSLGLIPFLEATNIREVSNAAGDSQPKSARAQSMRSDSNQLDEDTKKKIIELIGDFQFNRQKHTLKYATQLDHKVGRPQFSQGKHREAYRTYQEVLAISYHLDSLMGVQIGLGMLSSLLSDMNRWDEAMRVRGLAYRVAKKMDNPEEYGVQEMSIAQLLRQYDRAASLGWLAKARVSLKGTKYRSDYVRLLLMYAEDVAWLETKDATPLYEEVWIEVQRLGDSEIQRWAKWEVGLSYADFLTKQKRNDQAREVLAATTLWVGTANEANSTNTLLLFRLAQLFADSGQDIEAENFYLSAYANYEVLRVQALGEEARAKMDVRYKDSIDKFIELYIKQGKTEQALVLLESNKARTLSDITAEPNYRDRYAALQSVEQNYARARRDLFNSTDFDSQLNPESLFDKINELNDEQAIKMRALRTDMQLSNFAAAEPFSTKRLAGLRTQIPAATALVALFVSKRVSGAFVTTRDRVDWVELPESPHLYGKRAEQLKVALSNSETNYYREPARFFFNKLVQPILESLPGTVTTLVVSADGFLETIPFDVALNGDQFLAETVAVTRTPSFRLLTDFDMLGSSTVRFGVSCTDPAVHGARLPFQFDTSKILTEIFGDTHSSLTGEHCNIAELQAALADLAEDGFLHVGAHGQFYSGSPMESAIYLAGRNRDDPSEAWDVRSIATTDLDQVSLVTLSSCETGVVAESRPRDVFGILRGFYFAGVEQIIAPLWSVHDRATAEFMQSFYRTYNGDRQSAASALHRVKRTFSRSEKYRHPFYWAGFVLFTQSS